MTIHEKTIAGQTVSVVKNGVRGPLALLIRPNEPSIEARIHRDARGKYWYERLFKTHAQAVAFFESLPEGKSPAEMLAQTSQGAKALQRLNRILEGMTREQLAVQLGVSVSAIDHWRSGRRNPSKAVCKLMEELYPEW